MRGPVIWLGDRSQTIQANSLFGLYCSRMLILPLHWRRTLAANCFVAFRMFIPHTYHRQHVVMHNYASDISNTSINLSCMWWCDTISWYFIIQEHTDDQTEGEECLFIVDKGTRTGTSILHVHALSNSTVKSAITHRCHKYRMPLFSARTIDYLSRRWSSQPFGHQDVSHTMSAN